MKAFIYRSLIVFLFIIPVWSSGQNNNFEISKNLDIFTTLYRELHKNYVDEVQPGELMESAIEAMLETLDPFTNYIPESDIEDYKFMTTGQYGGIGALIHKRGKYVEIAELYEDYPAAKQGLLPGDKIIEIDNQSAIGKSSDDISSIMKGQPGSTLKIVVERDGIDEPVAKEIIRENIKIDNIPYYSVLDKDIGYIKLNGFTKDAWKDVKKSFNDLRENNELKGLIIDLRGNGGGLLIEAVNIANLFVEKDQLIVSTKGRLKDKNNVYKTRFTSIDTEIPLVILVDPTSASSSEILAGAIQDIDRGVIIGQRTYGKGLVQNVIPLSYNAKVKMTVAKYYIPSGRCIQAIDYFNKDKNGNPHKIPDSLINEFTTLNGRKVYDGGGIEPDIDMKPEKYANITKSLFTKFLIFDYVTRFANDNDSIPPIEEFEVSDEIFQDFLEFISDKDYDYTTESEKALEDLKKHAEKEKYYEAIAEDYEILKNKMMHDKEKDLFEFQDEIKNILEMEIATRYYYQKGKIKAALEEDPEIDKAIEILNNKTEYNKILNPVDLTKNE